ncbi:hypothetical protein [Moraxella lacunata]|uniref:hypothetical protein n=1 Tax=Moraxella lacunata TaxID=477 RepID=UPI003EDF516A
MSVCNIMAGFFVDNNTDVINSANTAYIANVHAFWVIMANPTATPKPIRFMSMAVSNRAFSEWGVV